MHTELLDGLVARACCAASGVYGFWPALSDGEDIVARRRRASSASACSASSAFTATRAELLPRGLRRARAGVHARRVRGPGGLGADALAARFEAEHDDYRAIMVKALADRLAEAFAECLHARAPPRVVRAGEDLERTT